MTTRLVRTGPELRPYRLDGPHPHYGGMLHIDHPTGLAHCCACDWQGAPTLLAGVIQTHCPACEHPLEQAPPTSPSPPRRRRPDSRAKRKQARQARRQNR